MTRKKNNFRVLFLFLVAITNGNITAHAEGNREYCWNEIAESTIASPELLTTLAIASTNQQIWAAWQEANAIRVSTWMEGKLATGSAAPESEKGSFEPILRATKEGDVFFARRSRVCQPDVLVSLIKDGKSIEFGSPQGKAACKNDAASFAMAIDDQGLPIVVWERRTGENLRYLLVARWNGSSWVQLGKPIPTFSPAYTLEPSIAVRSNQIWIAWIEGKESQSSVRVATWKRKEWIDVGKSQSANLRTKYSARHPKIIVKPNGKAFVVWAENGPQSGIVSAADWSGTKWQLVAPLPGEQNISALALLLGKDDLPTISWVSEDEGLNSNISVYQFGTHGWTKVFGGLHLANTPSFISQKDMAANTNGQLQLIWQEDQDRTASRHIVRLNPCEKGESSRPLPSRPARQSLWPQTVEAAATMILDTTDQKSKDQIALMSKSDLAGLHLGLGMSIRNNFGLRMGNTRLLESCGDGVPVAPDTCSGVILQRIWERLQH